MNATLPRISACYVERRDRLSRPTCGVAIVDGHRLLWRVEYGVTGPDQHAIELWPEALVRSIWPFQARADLARRLLTVACAEVT